MSKDRFDLEQEILQCWALVDDLKVLNEAILESDLDEDRITNVLIGVASLYDMKFQKLFDTFEHLIKTKQIL
jgi:hypothetical protein